jgi:hypothetical protein
MMTIVINQPQVIYSNNQLYHIQLDGVLNSAEINWNGEISIVDQPGDQSILVYLVVHAEEIRRFIEHFQVISLSIDTDVASEDDGLIPVVDIEPDREISLRISA